MDKYDKFEQSLHIMQLDEVQLANQHFIHQGFRDCSDAGSVLYLWKEYLGMQITFFEGFLITVNKWGQYSYPAGAGDKTQILKFLLGYCKSRGKPFVLNPIPEPALEHVKQVFECESEYFREYSDYLYYADDLKYLKGKKFHSRRNHMNKFKEQYPDYKYIKIDESNLERAKDFLDHIEQGNGDSALSEISTAYIALQNLEALALAGSMLEADGYIIALSMGEVMGDTLLVHYEKAKREINGAFAVINNEFVLHNATDGILYVNREEDMGVEGLRQAKLAYNPIQLINKYLVTVKGIK